MFSRTICARMAEQLPLYLSSDLKPRAARFVATHLEACENCRALASEYRASGEWIKQAARQEEFADEFYEGLRQSVLTRIKEQNTTPPASLFPALFWQRRPAFAAVALIVILLTAAFAAEFVFRQLPGARPEQQASVMPVATTPEPAPLPSSVNQEPQRVGDAQPPDQAQDMVANERRPQSRAAGRRIARQPAPATVPDESPIHSAGTVGIDMEPKATQAASASPVESTGMVASGEVTRIEIQTADPNIRIIWLTPPAAGSPVTEKIDNR